MSYYFTINKTKCQIIIKKKLQLDENKIKIHNRIMAEREIFQLEDMLKEFMIDELTRIPGEADNINLNRYKNLKLTIDTEGMFKEPNFKVQISILEAYFAIEDGLRLGGALGSTEEIIIRDWIRKGSTRALLHMYWMGESVDKKASKITPFDLE